MDEYPHWLAEREGPRFDDAAFAPWHEILAGAGCPHLIAVVPRVADDPETRDGAARDLSDVEVRRLAALADDGVEFGLHGYEHRTRFRNPRLHTELGHRPRREVGDLLDRALETLRERTGLQPRVLVPPFNTFGARQFPEFATRFRVVTGGPESVLRLGFHAGPTWRGDAVYLPAYPPLYGTAADVLPEVERRIEDETGLWTPVVLHWGWEAERGWKDLIRLVDAVAPYATRWSEFLDAVEMSR
ncbi:DUF2334 domain-containing protein [Actinomycetospora succinea]|nr:DUF2334 domain-containing protein [Actinomycetospora succinea]